MLFRLARLSLWNRRATVLLTLLSLSISIALVLAVDHLRNQARDSFNKTLSGTDLIVGARAGSVNLLLYTVFRVGDATQNMSWASFQELSKHSAVAWAIPISLGDSHKGYRVLGTNEDYFLHYQYGQQQSLAFDQGGVFNGVYEVVLGAEVAKKLGYKLGDEVIIAHGTAEVNLHKHDAQPFKVCGILKPTGTPVDRTLHTSLSALTAIHLDWKPGAGTEHHAAAEHENEHEHEHEHEHEQDLTPSSITAILVGLKSRAATFNLQRQINEYPQEPLLAILPGVALSQLWQMLAMVEQLLVVIALIILVAALLGMATNLLAAMNERQREIAILRSLGARAGFIFILIEVEILITVCLAFLLAVGLLIFGLYAGQSYLAEQFGLFISTNPLQPYTPLAAGVILAIALLLGAVPATAAYRRSLDEGLQQRL
ncbi:MAG: ABC transporter permease [Marinagarivorans sp.]